jgi:hypothetical protein
MPPAPVTVQVVVPYAVGGLAGEVTEHEPVPPQRVVAVVVNAALPRVVPPL